MAEGVHSDGSLVTLPNHTSWGSPCGSLHSSPRDMVSRRLWARPAFDPAPPPQLRLELPLTTHFSQSRESSLRPASRPLLGDLDELPHGRGHAFTKGHLRGGSGPGDADRDEEHGLSARGWPRRRQVHSDPAHRHTHTHTYAKQTAVLMWPASDCCLVCVCVCVCCVVGQLVGLRDGLYPRSADRQ